MIELQPPTPLAGPRPWVFLAGSIDDGRAENWQSVVIARLQSHRGTALNPRRTDWDSSWKQSVDDARFHEQVQWELEGQEKAELILMYFAATSMSPISLLELGLFAPHKGRARGGQLVVACADGYARRGNVEMVCTRYGITLLPDLASLIAEVTTRLIVPGRR